MNAVTTNNKYAQWLNSLPAAKSMAGLTRGRAGTDSGNLTLDFGYAERKTGFEALAQSWNRFVSKYTDDPGILFSEDSFLAYA